MSNLSVKQSKTISFLKRIKPIELVLAFFILFLLFALVSNPQTYIESTLNGILLWGTVVLPALLPFFILTRVLVHLQLVEVVCAQFRRVVQILFRAPAIAAYIFVMSILSGYPVGAKLTADCFEAGIITKQQAQKIATFTSTSGPMFIVGTVGAGMFFSKDTGFVILLCHILGSVLNGILYRNAFWDKQETDENAALPKKTTDLNQLFLASVSNATLSIIMVGGFIAFFFVIIQILADYNIFGALSQLFSPILSLLGISTELTSAALEGMVEITRGARSVADLNLDLRLSSVVCTFFISFGGASTYFQSLKFLSVCGISKKWFLLQKLTHGILSSLVAVVIFYVFGII